MGFFFLLKGLFELIDAGFGAAQAS